MSDQCLKCNHFNRPDMCSGEDCSIKESWYVLYLTQQIATLKVEMDSTDKAYQTLKDQVFDQQITNEILTAENKHLREALGALGIAADMVHKKLALIQPFLDVFLKHGKVIVECMEAQAALKEGAMKAENQQLEKWIDDLQSGMYINCVYCGYRYGPNSGPNTKDFNLTMRKALEQHIADCPKHPLSAAREQIAALTESRDDWKRQWRLMEAAEKKAEEQIATLKATYRCFNCGFETTDKAEAQAHFGDGEGEEAVCIHWYGMEDMEQATAYQEVLGELNQERDESVKLITENKQLMAALAEKDVEIAKTIQFGLEHTDQKNKQIAALEAALKGKDDMRSWERYSGALEEHNKLLKGQIFVLRNEKYDLLEKLTALTTENASLKEKREIWEERNVQLETKCCALTAENKRLREALEKYADKNNYGTHHEENRNVMGREYECDYITIDFGPEIAQDALKEESHE